MAIGDIGIFLPTESQYKNPGAYDELLKAEAAKNAAYLASMDQFYAELEEKQKEFKETLSFNESKLAAETALEEKKLQQQWSISQQELSLKKDELSYEKQKSSDTYDLYKGYLNNKDNSSTSSNQGNYMNLSGVNNNSSSSSDEIPIEEIDSTIGVNLNSDYDSLLASLGL
jgi:hypothetical protein